MQDLKTIVETFATFFFLVYGLYVCWWHYHHGMKGDSNHDTDAKD